MKNQLKWFGVFGFLLILACNNMETPKDEVTDVRLTDWINLLDSSQFSKWHTFGKPDSIGAAWSLSDGMLILDASHKNDWQVRDGGDIVYDEVFENFHFKLDWKIDSGGNSGIMFYVQEDTTYKYPWQTGPEMQVLDNAAHPDAKIIKHRAGDLYDLISCKEETVKPALEWNTAEIISDNGNLDFVLNGVNVVKTTMWDSTWTKMIANSKFKDMPGFGSFKTGKIALQDHGNNVWFRNVMIKRL